MFSRDRLDIKNDRLTRKHILSNSFLIQFISKYNLKTERTVKNLKEVCV